MRPVVAIDAHKESCTYVVRHWNENKAGPKRIPSTRTALAKLAQTYPDHDFVLEVCAVHEGKMDLLRDHGINALAVIPPKKGPVGKKSDDPAPEKGGFAGIRACIRGRRGVRYIQCRQSSRLVETTDGSA